MGLFRKNRKASRKAPETLSLKPDQVVEPASTRHESTLDDISYDLQGRLKKELDGLIAEVVDTALDKTRPDIEQMVRNELILMLEERLDKLVEQAIKKHLTKPRKPPGSA